VPIKLLGPAQNMFYSQSLRARLAAEFGLCKPDSRNERSGDDGCVREPKESAPNATYLAIRVGWAE